MPIARYVHQEDIRRKTHVKLGSGHLAYRLRMLRMKGRTLTSAEESAILGGRHRDARQLYAGSLAFARCFRPDGGAAILSDARDPQHRLIARRIRDWQELNAQATNPENQGGGD